MKSQEAQSPSLRCHKTVRKPGLDSTLPNSQLSVMLFAYQLENLSKITLGLARYFQEIPV